METRLLNTGTHPRPQPRLTPVSWNPSSEMLRERSKGGFAMYSAESNNGLARDIGCGVNDDRTIEVDDHGQTSVADAIPSATYRRAMSAVAPAPMAAEAAKRYRGGIVSERVSVAESTAPTTKPSWTAFGNHAVSALDSVNAVATSGPAAEALNLSLIASSSATTSRKRIRYRFVVGGSGRLPDTELRDLSWHRAAIPPSGFCATRLAVPDTDGSPVHSFALEPGV